MAKILTKNDIKLAYLGVYNRAVNGAEVDYWLNESSVNNSEELFKTIREVELGKDSKIIPETEHYEDTATLTAEHHRNRAFIELLYKHFFNKTTYNGIDEDRDDTALDGTTFILNGTTYKFDVAGGLYWTNDLDAGNIPYNVMLSALANAAFTDEIENQDDDLVYNRSAITAKDGYITTSISSDVSNVTLEIDNDTGLIVINGTSSIATNSQVVLSSIYDDATRDTAIQNLLPDPIDYIADYNKSYESLMEKNLTAANAPLKSLFDLIDATVDADITTRERLSLKKDAYMQMLSQVTMGTQKTAMSLVDKKHKFLYEIASMKAQADRAIAEAALTVSKEKVMLDQVIDNRRIKAMDSLGDTYSTGMAGGLVPTAAMWEEYFRLARELTRNTLEIDSLVYYQSSWKPLADTAGYTGGTAPLTATLTPDGGDVASKAIGNYWIVDLSDWDVSTPEPVGYDIGTNLMYLDENDVEMVNTIDGTPILYSKRDQTKPVTKTNIPGTLCTISLDGINYWKHGDIVYVTGIDTGKGSVVHTYRRIAGFAAGTNVTVAQDAVVGKNVIESLVGSE